MKSNKLERLARAGWEVGDTEDFLALSEEESKLVSLHRIDQCGEEFSGQT